MHLEINWAAFPVCKNPAERNNMNKAKKKMAANIIWFEIPADKPARAEILRQTVRLENQSASRHGGLLTH
jgi:hypothetical protein